MVLDRKSLHKYPVISGVSQDSILGPALSLLYINNLRDINWNIAVYAYDTTLHSEYDHASGFWQQLELAYEFESDMKGTDISINLPYSLAWNTLIISGLVLQATTWIC